MFTNLNQLALSKIPLDINRDTILPGNYHVDFHVHVKGELVVFDDEDYTPTTSVPLIAAMALALKKSGLQKANIINLLQESMTEMLNGGQAFEESVMQIGRAHV